jgi:hypothetical protein
MFVFEVDVDDDMVVEFRDCTTKQISMSSKQVRASFLHEANAARGGCRRPYQSYLICILYIKVKN